MRRIGAGGAAAFGAAAASAARKTAGGSRARERPGYVGPMLDTLASDELLRRYLSGERDFSGLDIADPPGEAPLRGAVLDGIDLSGGFVLVDFAGASLRGAYFVVTNVKTCSFRGADLRGADFRGAALDGAIFAGARLDGAAFEGAYVQSRVFAADETPDP